MSQAKIFKLLSEAYGLTWSGGIAAEVIDGCPVTLKEDRYYVQVSAYMPERVYEAKHEIFNEQMKAVKGVKCGFDKKTSRITTVLSQPNRVVEQYGALREIIKQYAAPYVEEDKCPYCGQGECDMAAIYNNQYRRVHVRCHQYHTDRTRDVVLSGQGNLAMGIIGALCKDADCRCSALFGDCTGNRHLCRKILWLVFCPGNVRSVRRIQAVPWALRKDRHGDSYPLQYSVNGIVSVL